MSVDLSLAHQFEYDGDGIEIQDVWSSCHQELMSLCLAYGYDRSTSEDICQETFLSTWEKAPEMIDEIGLRRWFFRTTINRCHQEFRANARRKSSLQTLKDLFARRSLAKRDHELHDILKTELDRLCHYERTVLIMTYYQRHTSAEISAIFGVPSSTIRTWLQTGRNKLAKRIAHLLEEEL